MHIGFFEVPCGPEGSSGRLGAAKVDKRLKNQGVLARIVTDQTAVQAPAGF